MWQKLFTVTQKLWETVLVTVATFSASSLVLRHG